MSEIRRQIVEYAKRMYDEKLVAATSGNISIYDRENDLIYITPSSVDYTGMEEADIMVIKPDGTVVEGIHRPSSEWKLHAELYVNLEGVGAVVHTHSPYATSFAVAGKEIPYILIEMKPFLKGSVKVSPFAAQGSREVGINAVPYLKERNACLMANHGVVAIGETLAQAYTRATYVEDAAKIGHMAVGLGNVNILPE